MNISLLYQTLRSLEPEKRMEYLISKGYPKNYAEDLLSDFEYNQPKTSKRLNEGKFSQSPRFKDIQERVKRLQEQTK